MLALESLLKRPQHDKKGFDELLATTATDRNECKEGIADGGYSEMEQKRHDDELTSTILESLRTPNRRTQHDTPTFAGTNIASNAVYACITDVLSAFQKDKMHPIVDTWKRDIEETENQLKLGARVALKNVREVLGAKVAGGDAKGLADEDGDMDMNVGGKAQLTCELLESLRYAERGVKRMTKGLPMNQGR
ncbi:hypothetical protein COCCADRAFT_37405 [Bipolaris zeicola 26-R-13]|uniref:Uncharacterized protein n=1 Tax=Cochliobolus carbonum (strain 26-R-13) TaxID=930089 RepID=W6Y4B6_COCC2|nr:uncharacterized protein COCCADRAFT_37405 [Bipolaris zeicola 26-R-13]EUC32728.1 hypothetical protein COCCADRAFT_37405 [Bipolaris zeicola 26-R-13]